MKQKISSLSEYLVMKCWFPTPLFAPKGYNIHHEVMFRIIELIFVYTWIARRVCLKLPTSYLEVDSDLVSDWTSLKEK